MSERLLSISNALTKENRVEDLRKGSKINKAHLASLLIPQNINKHFDEIYKMISDHPGIFQHHDIEELNRAQQRQLGSKMALTVMKTLKIDLEKDPYKFVAAMYGLGFFGIGPTIKSLVHYLLYIKTLLVFSDNQYHAEILQRAKRLQDIGSFSLTELHHGSFSRGIATEAVYDKNKREFILNSNGEAGMKFWIGAIAQTANKTILWAQLILDGVSYGPHSFVVQLRDDKTHQVLEGFTIGDCGPKNGLNVIDNGYTIINNVRIPAKAVLGKLGKVDENHKYVSIVKTNEQRFGLHMSPLSSGRALLSLTCLSQATAALTIAFRYACQRRQFRANQKQPEKLIIDYPVTRHRLLVPLASTIISYFPAANINRLYIQNSANFTDPTKRIVSELHAMSAVIKSKTSWLTNNVITECRQILGGHGYSSFSGLGRYYHDNDVNSTWEGDNNMLLQQTSKFIFKIIKEKEPGSLVNLQFVYDGIQSTEQDETSLCNIQNLRLLLQELFIHRLNSATKEMSKTKDEAKRRGVNPESIQNYVWNQIQPYFCNELALSYGDLIYFESAFHAFGRHKEQQHNEAFLSDCLRIWTYSSLLRASYGSLNTRKILQKLFLDATEKIYPDCIAVTDALAPPAFVMGSPFAQNEGMSSYINLLFGSKKAFGRIPWFQKLTQLREN